jgi:hypothetical protein
LDFWMVTNIIWKRHLVVNSYLGKVAKARPLISSGSEMAEIHWIALFFKHLGLILMTSWSRQCL